MKLRNHHATHNDDIDRPNAELYRGGNLAFAMPWKTNKSPKISPPLPITPHSRPHPHQPAASLPSLIAAIRFSIGVIFAGGSVAYHFLVNIPAREQAEASLKQQELENEKKRHKESSMRTSVAEAKYQECLSSASADYTSRWNKHCSTLSIEREQQYNRCVQINQGNDQYCGYIKKIPRSECQLPSETASNYDSSYDQQKRMCLEVRNTTLGS